MVELPPSSAAFFVDPQGRFSVDGQPLGEMVSANVDRFQRLIRRHQIRVPQRLSHRRQTGQLLVEMGQGAYAVARMPDRDESALSSNQYGRLLVIFSRDPADLDPVHLQASAFERLFADAHVAGQSVLRETLNLCQVNARAANQIEVVANFETPNGEENLLSLDELLSAVYAHHKTYLDRNLDFHYLYRTGVQIFENDAVRFAVRARPQLFDSGAAQTYDIRIILGDGYGSKLPDIDHDKNIGALIAHIAERALSGVEDRDHVIRPLFKCYSEAMRFGLAPSDISVLSNRPDLVQTVEDLHVRRRGVGERILQIIRYPLVRFFSKVLAQMSSKDQQKTGIIQLCVPVLSALSIATLQLLLRGMLAAIIAVIVSVFNNVFRLFRHTTKRVVMRSENIDLLNQPGRFIHPLMTENFDQSTQGPINPAILQNLVYIDARNPEEEISSEVHPSELAPSGPLSGASDVLDPASACHGAIYSLLRFQDAAGVLSPNEILHIEQPAPRFGFDTFHIFHDLPERPQCRRVAYLRARPDLANASATPMEKAVRRMFESFGEATRQTLYLRISEVEASGVSVEALTAEAFLRDLAKDASAPTARVDRPQIREQMAVLERWIEAQEQIRDLEAVERGLWARCCRRLGLFRRRAWRRATLRRETRKKLAAIQSRDLWSNETTVAPPPES